MIHRFVNIALKLFWSRYSRSWDCHPGRVLSNAVQNIFAKQEHHLQKCIHIRHPPSFLSTKIIIFQFLRNLEKKFWPHFMFFSYYWKNWIFFCPVTRGCKCKGIVIIQKKKSNSIDFILQLYFFPRWIIFAQKKSLTQA